MASSVPFSIYPSHSEMHTDLHHPDFFQDPYPFYAKLRRADEPVWIPHHNPSTTTAGVWLFSRHEDAVSLFKAHGRTSHAIAKLRPPGMENVYDLNMLLRDGADHLRLRRLVGEFFTTRAVADLNPFIARTIRERIVAIEQQDSADLVSGFAAQIPVRVIAHLLGVAYDDLVKLSEWSLKIVGGLDSLLIEEQSVAAQYAAFKDLVEFIDVQLKNADRLDQTGMIPFLISAEREGKISRDEVRAMIAFLLLNGHLTTVNLISSGLLLLIRHPDQRALLQQQPALAGSAVDEILRYESPLQRTVFRIAIEPIKIRDFTLEAGQQFGVIMGAANRDEAVFQDAGRFDIRREPNPHLAFGAGLHQCLGKHLALTEGRMAISEMVLAFPEMKMIDEKPAWLRNSFSRGLERLPVTLS